jgi:hypothetical protein
MYYTYLCLFSNTFFLKHNFLKRLLGIGKPFAILIPYQQLGTVTFRKELARLLAGSGYSVINLPASIEFYKTCEERDVNIGQTVWLFKGIPTLTQGFKSFVV